MEQGDDTSLWAQIPLYKYEALRDYPSDTIRLLKLLPGHTEDDMHATLTMVRLNEQPEFRALSYTWGDSKDHNYIYIDGRRLIVRRNLWTFLRRLRRDGQAEYLWADAICVNQEDLEERSAQVQLMSKIYSEAQKVCAWLGEELPDKGPHPYVEETLNKYSNSYPGWASLEIYSEMEALLDEFLCNWSFHPYWSRMWIVQEVLLAQSIVLLYGTKGELDWETYYSWIENSRKVAAAPTAHKFLISSTHSYRRSVSRTTSRVSLFELVKNHGGSECFDPRDKIYALLGLGHSQGLRADYRQPPAAFFWNVCCAYSYYEREGGCQRLLEVLKLNTHDLRTLVLCLVVVRRATWMGSLRLRMWLSRYVEQSARSGYDKILVEWFQCPRETWSEVMELVNQDENRIRRRLDQLRPFQPWTREEEHEQGWVRKKLEGQLETSFLDTAARWSKETNAPLRSDAVHLN